MQTWSWLRGEWREGEAAEAEAYWFALSRDDRGQLERLAERYHLHPLAVEDCISPLLHAPKIDDFGDYLFIVQTATTGASGDDAVEELDAFLSATFVITYADNIRPFEELFASLQTVLRERRPVREGTDGILYEITDRAVDATLLHVNALAEELDQLTQQALNAESPAGHREITQIRARAGMLRRLLTGELAVVQRLGRGEFVQVSEPNRVYFRDIYDHLVRIDLSLESVREDAEVALSTSLSVLNNQMNEVMKVLAIVGALALPATVIASIFGTNFHHMPWLQSAWGFWAMIAVMAGVGAAMAGYFWRRGWF